MHVKIKRFLAVFQCDLLVLGRITSCTSLDLVFILISNWSAEGCVREDWKMKKFKRVCDRSLSLSLLIESKSGFASLSPCEIGRHIVDCGEMQVASVGRECNATWL